MRSMFVCLLAAGLLVAACATSAESSTPPAPSGPATTVPVTIEAGEVTASLPTTTRAPETTTTLARPMGVAAPEWLGTRLLPLRPGEENGVARPTPAELIDRRLWTIDVLPSPVDDRFVSEVLSPPPDDVVARSTWRDDCPVGLDQLAYAQVSFYGFDGLFHTGEFIAHTNHVDGLVGVFSQLHAMRFPIEEMAVTTQEAVDAHPTGDSNNTSSFVCRPAVNSRSWSRHASGGAVDLNPFQNPYLKADLVIPELASAYLDRDDERNGMVTAAIVDLFAEVGWSWGGVWSTASDWMHFSDTGG